MSPCSARCFGSNPRSRSTAAPRAAWARSLKGPTETQRDGLVFDVDITGWVRAEDGAPAELAVAADPAARRGRLSDTSLIWGSGSVAAAVGGTGAGAGASIHPAQAR